MSYSDLPIISINEKHALEEGEYLFFVDFDEPIFLHKGFFMFLSIVKNSDELDVFFQSAYPDHKPLTEQDYNTTSVTFEGVGQARTRKRNVLSISDFGHYIPGISSSFFCGSANVNYCEKIGNAIETIIDRMGIRHSHVVFIGSSAGADGVLRTATYMKQPVAAIAVNPWIWLHNLKQLRDYHIGAFGADLSQDEILKKYGAQLSAIVRYQEATVKPVLRLLLNKNDKRCFEAGISFISSCSRGFQRLVVDIYDGAHEHVRPLKEEYLRKIEETRMLGYEELTKNDVAYQYKKGKGIDLFQHIEKILLTRKGQKPDYLRYFGELAISCGNPDSAERLLRAALKERPNGGRIKQLLEQAIAGNK